MYLYSKQQSGFTMVLNIRDGTVVTVSSNITRVLGFPVEMISGHSFIEFVSPQDFVHFSLQIINGMSIPMNDSLKSE